MGTAPQKNSTPPRVELATPTSGELRNLAITSIAANGDGIPRCASV